MKKITLIHFKPGDHIALTPHAIMKHLGADALHDFGANAGVATSKVRDMIRLARRSKHVAVLTLYDNNVSETLNRLIKCDDLAIDVQHTSYRMVAAQILNVTELSQRPAASLSELELRIIAQYANPLTAAEIQLKVDEWRKQNPQLAFYGACMAAQIDPLDLPSVEKSAEEFSAALIDGMAPGEAIRKAMTEIPAGRSPRGRRKDTGETVREWLTPEYRFPHIPVTLSIPDKKVHIRGVANGATMYAMGLVEGMAVGDRYITFIVNGDEDAKKIFNDYPFIRWDLGRIQVRTVSEVLMVNAEDKAALGYAEWVADVTPENLKALLELDRWQHFVAFLSGWHFDRFIEDQGL